MNKNDFLKGLESKDIIQLIENDGTKELVFTEKNTIATVEKRFHHKNIVFNDLKDFVKFSNNQDDGTVIYNFKENKIYHTQQMQLEMEKEILSVDWFAPIRTDEFKE